MASELVSVIFPVGVWVHVIGGDVGLSEYISVNSTWHALCLSVVHCRNIIMVNMGLACHACDIQGCGEVEVSYLNGYNDSDIHIQMGITKRVHTCKWV